MKKRKRKDRKWREERFKKRKKKKITLSKTRKEQRSNNYEKDQNQNLRKRKEKEKEQSTMTSTLSISKKYFQICMYFSYNSKYSCCHKNFFNILCSKWSNCIWHKLLHCGWICYYFRELHSFMSCRKIAYERLHFSP